MRRRWIFPVTIFALLVLVAPVWATSVLVKDIDTSDSHTDRNKRYWSGSDKNNSSKLKNGKQATEEAWLQGLLGRAYKKHGLLVVYTLKDFKGNCKRLKGYDLDSDWDFAVVKDGRHWVTYKNDGSDALTTKLLKHRINHVTFYSETDPPKPDSITDPGPSAPLNSVPEPSTLLLFGPALAGLVAWRLKKEGNGPVA